MNCQKKDTLIDIATSSTFVVNEYVDSYLVLGIWISDRSLAIARLSATSCILLRSYITYVCCEHLALKSSVTCQRSRVRTSASSCCVNWWRGMCWHVLCRWRSSWRLSLEEVMSLADVAAEFNHRRYAVNTCSYLTCHNRKVNIDWTFCIDFGFCSKLQT